jgi:hypothetical protein
MRRAFRRGRGISIMRSARDCFTLIVAPKEKV